MTTSTPVRKHFFVRSMLSHHQYLGSESERKGRHRNKREEDDYSRADSKIEVILSPGDKSLHIRITEKHSYRNSHTKSPTSEACLCVLDESCHEVTFCFATTQKIISMACRQRRTPHQRLHRPRRTSRLAHHSPQSSLSRAC